MKILFSTSLFHPAACESKPSQADRLAEVHTAGRVKAGDTVRKLTLHLHLP